MPCDSLLSRGAPTGCLIKAIEAESARPGSIVIHKPWFVETPRVCPSSNAPIDASFSVSMTEITQAVGRQTVSWRPGQRQRDVIETIESEKSMSRSQSVKCEYRIWPGRHGMSDGRSSGSDCRRAAESSCRTADSE